ncbi:hypothetical protein LSH36_281g03047 [Paralvinella palmiformis]|uniref:Mediator of RNA polymerase II transcription subunit 30 n=1 Tax=Paralvinella palmiformis TaxID=53620 RepID=A0AAD9JIX9_9ANNE|nr:hypothetical protein LSH36_281g03047 [Paralvinella palmiformis]
MSQIPVSTPFSNVTTGATFKPLNTPTTAVTTAGQPQMAAPSGVMTQSVLQAKDVNVATLCRHGQEMVQDIVQKTTEIFQWLKAIYLPNGTTVTPAMCHERWRKLEEHIRNVNNSFHKLLLIYNKVKEYKAEKPIEDYLPLEVNGEVKGEQPKITESVVAASEEHKDIIEKIHLKNQQLKDIIDQLRTIIWEINTMMAVKQL